MKILTNTLAFASKTETLPPAYQPLNRVELVILVGLTGVGKSTVLELLQQQVNFQLLPNRRELTDEIIIASLQQADGQPIELVTDRTARFDYTARYRAQNPGGMAYALSQLVVMPHETASLFVFDGLRGLDEVQHAVDYFPTARFIVLDAPDTVRLNRLLARADTFDMVSGEIASMAQTTMKTLKAVPGVEIVFTDQELTQLVQAIAEGQFDPDEVVKKTTIIVKERRNYDSRATRDYLSQTLPPKRVLVIDTAVYPASDVVAQIHTWLVKI